VVWKPVDAMGDRPSPWNSMVAAFSLMYLAMVRSPPLRPRRRPPLACTASGGGGGGRARGIARGRGRVPQVSCAFHAFHCTEFAGQVCRAAASRSGHTKFSMARGGRAERCRLHRILYWYAVRGIDSALAGAVPPGGPAHCHLHDTGRRAHAGLRRRLCLRGAPPPPRGACRQSVG
jgi:hypothetical protein